MDVVQVADASPEWVLANAVVRAATALGLNCKELGQTIGFSVPTVSRITKGGRAISPHSKEGELSVLLLRLYTALDAMVGGCEAKRRRWMITYNTALREEPLTLIKKVEGLMRVVIYLEGAVLRV